MATSLFCILFIFLVEYSYSRSVYDNTFMKVRNAKTFVDKTPLIYEFIVHHRYLFVNAPGMFGKSTNMDMLSLFLSNHRPKQDIENFFIWTKIWENEDFVKQHMGQYPVIYFNLKVRGFSSDFEHTLTEFKVSLYNAFIDHMYLLESEALTKQQLDKMRYYTDLTSTKLMDTETVARGLGFLAEVLYKHHGKQVILLADEFGRGITEGILQNHIDLPSIVHLYSVILNNTFHNQSLFSHALLSGESWLYGVQAPAVSLLERISFMQKVEFSRFYGFTYDEVNQLLDKYNVSKSERKEVFQWYGGYSTYDGLFKVCCPYSITQYLGHKKRETMIIWSGSAVAPDLIRRMVEIDNLKKQVLDLVLKKPVTMNIEKDTKVEDVKFLTQKVAELPQYCENFFLQILVEAGYLTFDENQSQTSNISLVLPNEEIRSAVIKFTV